MRPRVTIVTLAHSTKLNVRTVKLCSDPVRNLK